MFRFYYKKVKNVDFLTGGWNGRWDPQKSFFMNSA